MRRFTEALIDRLMIVLVALFVVFGAIVVWRLNIIAERVLRAGAIQDARLLAVTITEFRSLYTSEVVARLRERGTPVVHDYPDHEGAIPLPATLSIELGKRIGGAQFGAEVRLYSDYPFPWRKDGGVRDEFEKEALETLRQRPDGPFFRFENYGGRPSLRYAVADTMRSACVKCHNAHPSSPKRDWNVGDVRGVLEIVAPLDNATALATRSIYQDSALILVGGAFSALAFGLTMGRLRKNARTLRTRNEDLRKLAVELRASNEVLERQSTTDALTGLLNRRSLDTNLALEWRRATREGRNVAVLMIDVDDFKAFNDRYGHAAGDECLKAVARVLSARSRRTGDWAARYGGEEFAIVLPHTSLAHALDIAESIRVDVARLQIAHEASEVASTVTVSIGAAEMSASSNVEPTALVEAADRALYEAKRAGRNRVVGA